MIRKMVSEDRAAVANLMKMLYGKEEDFVYGMLEQDCKRGVRYFVACEDGVVDGVISFGIVDSICKIQSHAVDKSKWNNGIGSELMNHMEIFASESCAVAEATTYEERYMDFLIKRGYRPALFQAGFVLMRKRLS